MRKEGGGKVRGRGKVRKEGGGKVRGRGKLRRGGVMTHCQT